MAKDLAKEIGYTYIDTGAMYRAVTLYCIQHGFFEGEKIKEEELKASIHDIDISFRLNAETGRPDTYLNGVNVEKEIRGMEVADKVSPVATLGFVRRALVAKQQEMGKAKGIVMDGRDIGTVVFPDAELKLFVTASPELSGRETGALVRGNAPALIWAWGRVRLMLLHHCPARVYLGLQSGHASCRMCDEHVPDALAGQTLIDRRGKAFPLLRQRLPDGDRVVQRLALGVDPGAAKAAPPGGLVGGVYRAHRAELFKMLFHIRVGAAAFGQITHLIDAHCCGTSLCAKLVILPLSNSITP